MNKIAENLVDDIMKYHKANINFKIVVNGKFYRYLQEHQAGYLAYIVLENETIIEYFNHKLKIDLNLQEYYKIQAEE